MIDIIVSTSGTVMVAHDRDEMGRVAEIRIDAADRRVSVLLEDGEERSLGKLQPSMMEHALAASHGSVTALDGWNSEPPYDCTLRVSGA